MPCSAASYRPGEPPISEGWRPRPGLSIVCDEVHCWVCYEDDPDHTPDEDDGRDMTPPYEP